MRTTLFTVAVAAGSAYAQQSIYGRCGGRGYSGSTSCSSGAVCSSFNPYYAQCVPGTVAPSAPPATSAASVAIPTASACVLSYVTVAPSPSATSVAALSTSVAATSFGNSSAPVSKPSAPAPSSKSAVLSSSAAVAPTSAPAPASSSVIRSSKISAPSTYRHGSSASAVSSIYHAPTSSAAAVSSSKPVVSKSSAAASSVAAVSSSKAVLSTSSAPASSAAAVSSSKVVLSMSSAPASSAAAVSSSKPAPSMSSAPAPSSVAPVSTSHVLSTYHAPSSSSAVVPSSKPVASTSSVAAPSSKPVSSAAPVPSTSRAAAPTSSAPAAAPSGVVSYAGLNIAGFDFGCTTDGTCVVPSAYPPGTNGINQIKHFVTNDGLNAFRLPVGWQYLLNGNLGGTLDATNFANYDSLVQGCLSAGASMCIIDIHNYARWNGKIIGQGGPTNAQFASLWSQLASKYKNNAAVAFGVMNEPHDIPDITLWAASVQAAVTAIRQAGATTQKILLPGNDYTSAASFISNGSGAALLKVVNADGSTTNLIFDVHKYLDSDGSGTHPVCVTNAVSIFQTLGAWLRTNGRKAMLTETGGGNTDSTCLTYVCQELAELNTYNDVYLGWTGWSAGQFSNTDAMAMTPLGSYGGYTDQPLVKQCIAGQFKKQA